MRDNLNNLKNKTLGVILIMMFCCFKTFGQEKTITGVVKDDKGVPLPAASIIIKGKKTGAFTDFDGKYTIKAAPNDVLVFNFLGYKKKEVLVGESTTVDVALYPDVSTLDEIVVIGYGSVKRKDLTGSVATIKSEELRKIQTTSFEGALASKIAGVQVVRSEGGPDAAFKIRVRGGTSINASNDPLYVVDGFPISGGPVSTADGISNSSTNPLANLDPNNIESIDILKDASAAAIYGSRGANGVVIITTKKGKKGFTNLSFDAFTSVSDLSNRLDVLTPEEFISFSNDFQPWSPTLTDQKKYLAERYRIDDGTGNYIPVPLDYPGLIIDDWQEAITRSAITNNYRLSANGGTDKTNYNASFSYLDREGIIKTTGIERYSLNFNINQKVTKKLSAGFLLNGGLSERSGVVSSASNNSAGRAGVVTSAALFNPIQPIRHNDNSEIEESLGITYDEDGRQLTNQNGDIANPSILLEENTKKGQTLQAYFGTFLEYKIIDGLKFKSSLRGFVSNTKNKSYFSDRVGFSRTFEGMSITDFSNFKSFTTEQNLTYNKRFGKHSINAVLVAERITNYFESTRTTSTGFELPGVNVDDLGSALETRPSQSNATVSSLQSYLARVQYDAFNKYLLTASLRYDGSSRFAEDNRWGLFPSIGFAWRLSNENFMKNVPFISDAKIRLSYGETGNFEIPAGNSLSRVNSTNYIFDGSDITTGAAITRIANEDLTWETTTQTDVGLNLGFFDNRFNIDADYYNKETSDLLLNVPIPTSSGYQVAFQNLGLVRNHGFEFSINSTNIQSNNFKWTSNFNISFNKNKVLDLGGANEFFVTAIGDNQIVGDYVVRVGEALGSIYGLQDDGVYTYSDFVEFDGLTDAEAAELLYSNVTGDENWYSVNIYNLKPGVVENSLVAPGTYRPGMTKFVDKNGDGVINDEDKHIIGNTQPIHFGGFTNNFSYKDFDLSIQMAWSYGNDIYNKNIKKGSNTANPWANKLSIVNERWSPETPSNTLTSFNTGASGNFNSAAYSRFIEDGSFLRIANITLGYNLPNDVVKSIGLKKLRIYGAADNVFLWTDYSGWDPDVSVGRNQLTPGLDIDAYPRARTFRFGINAQF